MASVHVGNTVGGFIEGAFEIIDSCSRALLDDDCNINTLESCANRLTALLRNVRRMATRYLRFNELGSILERMLEDIDRQKSMGNPSVGFFAAKQQRTKGRPLYIISREQLDYFVEAGFTRRQMSQMLHVSDSVVKRRLRQYGISIRSKYSSISDRDLDEKVREVTRENMALGQRMIQGILQSQGLRIQRQRISDSLIRVDEAAVAMRWCRSIRRRVYRVSGPNALWHIDGNHKLIRWGFVIHGGIDGFSRLVVFLAAATNNRAATMTEAFMSGTQRYGVPSRVRSDKGLENSGVGAFMIATRGPGRGSFLTGRSVHNQRIERLWRDLYQGCTNVFHRLFHHMESTGQLDLDSDLQLWCLQFVFLPRIQRALQHFQQAWNVHSLSSEGGRSPTQLYIQGMVQQAGHGHRGVDDMFFEPDMSEIEVPEQEYGVDEEAPESTPYEPSSQITNIPQPVSDNVIEQLKSQINPLDGDGLGLDLYGRSVQFCQAALNE